VVRVRWPLTLRPRECLTPLQDFILISL
jgi:hypothetical protein